MPNNPTLLAMPFARDADKNVIPITDNGATGLLSQQYGFQQINAIPVQQGGKAVKREDFNGALNLLGGIAYMSQRGYVFEWDENQDYLMGCVVRDPNNGGQYIAINDVTHNSTPPSSDTTNWARYDRYVLRSTTYSAGATAELPNIPAGYFLECTTAGTTSSTAPTVTTPVAAGDTITDGTVTWTVRQCFPTSGGTLIGETLRRTGISDRLVIFGGSNSGNGGFIVLDGKANSDITSYDDIVASISVPYSGGNGFYRLGLTMNGGLIWTDSSNNAKDLGGSAIVAKSLGTNGYIKYASGFILQWGKSTGSNASITIDLPISFTSKYALVSSVDSSLYSAYDLEVRTYSETTSHFKAYVKNTSSAASIGFSWVAIGY